MNWIYMYVLYLNLFMYIFLYLAIIKCLYYLKRIFSVSSLYNKNTRVYVKA